MHSILTKQQLQATFIPYTLDKHLISSQIHSMLTEKILLNQAIKNETENMKSTVNYNYLFIYSSTNTCDESLNNRL